MARRQSVRTDLLDWCQAVLDETKELVDDNIDRLRGRPESRHEAEVEELRQQISELTAAVEAMAPPDHGRSPKGR